MPILPAFPQAVSAHLSKWEAGGMFRAILVDDDKWALADIRAVFQSIESGFELAGAFTNADDALVYLMNHPVDLVMTDICMGGKSGFDLLRLTAENRLSFISIIISGHDDFQYVQNAFINRCFYYLLKPVKKAELAEVLNRACAEIAFAREKALPDAGGEHADSTAYDRAVAYLNEHFSEQFSLEDMAVSLFTNPSYLSRVFSQRSGCTISQYRNILRVQRAKVLLAEGGRSILEIALLVGFDSASYFCRKFKEITGVSPQDYRRRAAVR